MSANLNTKSRFEFLKANKLADPADPRSVALFLKSTPRLDKSLVGNFLGKRDNVPVTKEYQLPPLSPYIISLSFEKRHILVLVP